MIGYDNHLFATGYCTINDKNINRESNKSAHFIDSIKGAKDKR